MPDAHHGLENVDAHQCHLTFPIIDSPNNQHAAFPVPIASQSITSLGIRETSVDNCDLALAGPNSALGLVGSVWEVGQKVDIAHPMHSAMLDALKYILSFRKNFRGLK